MNASNVTTKTDSDNKNLVYTLDSGCANHIDNCDKYYCFPVLLKYSVYIKVGYGNRELVMKVGNIRCIFEVM